MPLDGMDPRLVAAMARHRLRGAIVATVVRAGPDGIAEDDIRAGLRRVMAAGATQADVEWGMRSLGRDGLLTLDAGRVKLGPKAVEWLKAWAEQRIAAAPTEAKA